MRPSRRTLHAGGRFGELLVQVEPLESVGRYEIVGELGTGSMSRVYLAHDPNLDRKVALKVVFQGFSLDTREQSELERRFLLEARAAGKLSHPSIVRVYDADSDPATGIPYIAMEWVKGRSLRSLLEDQGRLSGPRALEILAQVARALDYAHRSGRIHRDIKPSNILIGTDGTAKVSDFGVAKIMSESHTISGQVLGTPAYMSPEQVKDDPLDGRSDLFSLGAVLYQSVSGNTPFGGDSLVQVVYKILNVDPRPLKLSPTPALTQLTRVVDRALQKDPSARFQTGGEFAEALDDVRSVLASEPSSDFRVPATPVKPGSSSDTIPVRAAIARKLRSQASAGETRTVRLSTTSIHRAVSSETPPAAHQDSPLETVATSLPPAVRAPGRARRLALAASLAALGLILGGIAVIRWPRQESASAPAPVSETPAVSASPTPEADLADPVGRANSARALPTASSSPPAVARGTGDVEADLIETAPTEPAAAEPEPRIEDQTAVVQAEPTPPDEVHKDGPAPTGSLTPVTILYRHKGGLAFLTVLLDGVRVWNQQLKPVQGRLQKLTGYEARAVIPVPPGVHTLQIRLKDPERRVDASHGIRSRYTNGTRRTLRVQIDPDDNTVQLRWKE